MVGIKRDEIAFFLPLRKKFVEKQNAIKSPGFTFNLFNTKLNR